MADSPHRIVLASRSPYRRQLLQRLVPAFDTVVPAVEETPTDGETPAQMALRLSQAKAKAVAAIHPNAAVIGGDQVASLDGRIVGKPGDHPTAVQQLTDCSARAVEFHTGVCVVAANGFTESYVDKSVVFFRQLSGDLIEHYLRKEQPYDCAGSFKAEQLGVILFERIETSDPAAIQGLPMIWLAACLGRAGIELL